MSTDEICNHYCIAKIKIIQSSKSQKSFCYRPVFSGSITSLFHMVETCASLSKDVAKGDKHYKKTKIIIVRISTFIIGASEICRRQRQSSISCRTFTCLWQRKKTASFLKHSAGYSSGPLITQKDVKVHRSGFIRHDGPNIFQMIKLQKVSDSTSAAITNS